MSDSALKLAHIFWEAGAAFTKLAELTREWQYSNDNQLNCRWTEEEIDMLRTCVHRFALDLNELSLHIKTKTLDQIKRTLKKKAFEDAGIPLPEEMGEDSDAPTDREEVDDTPEPATLSDSDNVSSDRGSWETDTDEEASP